MSNLAQTVPYATCRLLCRPIDFLDFPQTISAEFIAKDTGVSAVKSRPVWSCPSPALPVPGPSIHHPDGGRTLQTDRLNRLTDGAWVSWVKAWNAVTIRFSALARIQHSIAMRSIHLPSIQTLTDVSDHGGP